MELGKNRINVGGAVLVVAVLVVTGCTMTGEPDEGSDPLTVVATSDAEAAFEGQSVSLTAEAAGGTAPYIYHWDVNASPVPVYIEEPVSSSINVGPLTEAGLYNFRVVVTDDDGETDYDFVAIDVASPVTSTVPRLILVGEDAELVAEINPDAPPVTVLWEVVSGAAVIADPASPVTTLTVQVAETIEMMLTTTLSTESESTTETFFVVAVDDLSPRVSVESTLGDMTFELEGEASPLHTAAFLQYVDEGFHDGLVFHRVACTSDAESEECEPFVIQGGGFERVGEELVLREPTQPFVPTEADNGLTNGDVLTIALALSSGPNTGFSQFFINMGDNGFLDDSGFTVFGRVVEGASVLEDITMVETEDSTIIPGEPSQPVEDIVIDRMIRIVE
ncbi:MAG: peptidylprolyl isomerase [Planctomycetota bacterium]